MKRFSTHIFYILLFVAMPALSQAQDMADGMRANGKIYVVVSVLATIFAGIFFFLIYLERKIKKMEHNDQ